jgi:hypothetical protein
VQQGHDEDEESPFSHLVVQQHRLATVAKGPTRYPDDAPVDEIEAEFPNELSIEGSPASSDGILSTTALSIRYGARSRPTGSIGGQRTEIGRPSLLSLLGRTAR